MMETPQHRAVRRYRKRSRGTVSQNLSNAAPKTGGIFAALRSSPLVGAELDVKRIVSSTKAVNWDETEVRRQQRPRAVAKPAKGPKKGK
jgi:hypothetical protein